MWRRVLNYLKYFTWLIRRNGSFYNQWAAGIGAKFQVHLQFQVKDELSFLDLCIPLPPAYKLDQF